MNKVINNAIECVQRIHFIFNNLRKGPETLYAFNCLQPTFKVSQNSKFSIKDLIGNGILWAVPRNRRTVERRWQRKFGSPDYVWKLIHSKTTLKTCNQCGHDHEVGVLCPHCYEIIKKETELMQEKIQVSLGNEEIDREIIVLYDGEKSQSSEFFNGKRVVELQKSRPMWFSKNLTQKSTQKHTTTKEIKPSDLG